MDGCMCYVVQVKQMVEFLTVLQASGLLRTDFGADIFPPCMLVVTPQGAYAVTLYPLP